jgi:hypothetical protein
MMREQLGVKREKKVALVVWIFHPNPFNEPQRNMRAYLNITYCLLDISLHLLTQHAFKDKGVAKLLSLKEGRK